MHYILANVLMYIKNSGKFLVLAAHDVSCAFNSGVHFHLLYCAQQPRLDCSIVLVNENLYARSCVVAIVPTHHCYVMCKAVIRVWKDLHQGGLTLPPLYNNSLVAPQKH